MSTIASYLNSCFTSFNLEKVNQTARVTYLTSEPTARLFTTLTGVNNVFVNSTANKVAHLAEQAIPFLSFFSILEKIGIIFEDFSNKEWKNLSLEKFAYIAFSLIIDVLSILFPTAIDKERNVYLLTCLTGISFVGSGLAKGIGFVRKESDKQKEIWQQFNDLKEYIEGLITHAGSPGTSSCYNQVLDAFPIKHLSLPNALELNTVVKCLESRISCLREKLTRDIEYKNSLNTLTSVRSDYANALEEWAEDDDVTNEEHIPYIRQDAQANANEAQQIQQQMNEKLQDLLDKLNQNISDLESFESGSAFFAIYQTSIKIILGSLLLLTLFDLFAFLNAYKAISIPLFYFLDLLVDLSNQMYNNYQENFGFFAGIKV